MFDIFTSKTKLQYYSIQQISLEQLEIIGIGQINKHCKKKYADEIFLTLVNILNDSKKYDEKEGLIISDYFTLKKCPKCHREELVPVKLTLNFYPKYIKNEQEYIHNPQVIFKSRYTIPSIAYTYCQKCASAYQIYIKSSDIWFKEAKKIKEQDLLFQNWEEYKLD